MSKQILRFLVALVVLTGAIFLSCDPEIITPSSGLFFADVDDVSFNADEVNAQLFVSGSDSTLEITATNANNEVIEIRITQPKVTSYSFSSTGSNVDFTYKSASGQTTFSENTISGKVTIYKYDLDERDTAGDFSFETDNSSITNGSFTSVGF